MIDGQECVNMVSWTF